MGIGIGGMSRDLPRGDRPKQDMTYRCPWCNHITRDNDKARMHSLSCSKRNEAYHELIKMIPERELNKLAKER